MSSSGPSPASKSPLTKSSVVSPIPTPSYPSSGAWSVLTTTTITAPLQTVLSISLDASRWPKWNSFVSQADVISQPPSVLTSPQIEVGTKLRFHSRMKLDGPRSAANSDHEIVSIDHFQKYGRKAARIVWKTIGIPLGTWLMTAERVQEFVEIEMEDCKVGTEYTSWGTFGGPLSDLLAWNGTRNDIVERFSDWAGDLKVYAERQQTV